MAPRMSALSLQPVNLKRSPTHTALFNLVFLNLYDAGLAHTEGEHRQWLAAAELTGAQKLSLGTDTVITATRA